MKKLLTSFVAASVAVTGLTVATPAAADPPPWAKAHGKRYKDRHHDDDDDRYYYRDRRYDDDDGYYYRDRRYDDRRYYRDRVRIYDDRGYYVQPRRITRSSYVWRGDNGRYYCRRDNGTTGLIIGAGVGALAGREIARRGDRTLGAILGAVGGGLLGRAIDRGELRCR